MSRDLAALDGQCPATRGRQVCASIGLHGRHVWVDPEPKPAEQPETLIVAVRRAAHDVWCQPNCHVLGHEGAAMTAETAEAIVAAVRAYDAEQATKPATGVPPCPGLTWTGNPGDRHGHARTQPLGHHGGCR